MSKGYLKFNVAIKGETIIMHNGQTADPLNPYARAMKTISAKRKKTEADFKAMADLEFEAGLYLSASKDVIVPSRVIEAAICEGARKSKEGKLALSGVFADSDLVLNYKGGIKTVSELKEDPEFRLAVPVRVGQSRVVRTRPLFRGWSGTFQISLNSEVANASQLRRWIEDTGAYLGLGDWRPRHGRFEVSAFDAI